MPDPRLRSLRNGRAKNYLLVLMGRLVAMRDHQASMKALLRNETHQDGWQRRIDIIIERAAFGMRPATQVAPNAAKPAFAGSNRSAHN